MLQPREVALCRRCECMEGDGVSQSAPPHTRPPYWALSSAGVRAGGGGGRSYKQAVSGCLRNSFIHKPNQVSALPTTALSHPQATWTPHFFHSGIAGNHPAKCPKDPTEENMVERCGTGMWLLFNSDFLGAQSRWISPFTLKSFHLTPCQFSVF